MQQFPLKLALAGASALFLFILSGCYKCYTSGCSEAFQKAVEDQINNNPYIVDYENRKILCEAAKNSPLSTVAYTNNVQCTVTWQVSTN